MRKMKIIRVNILLTCILILITGCSAAKSYENIPLERPLSESELIDYYAKASEFDTIARKNVEVYERKYETYTVQDEDKLTKIKQEIKNIESELSQFKYSDEFEHVSVYDFNYFKSMLGSNKLTDGKVTEVESALGFFFVDVEYKVTAGEIGSYTSRADMVGINGAFSEDKYLCTDTIDAVYLKNVAKEMNAYYFDNEIAKGVIFNEIEKDIELVKYSIDPNETGTYIIRALNSEVDDIVVGEDVLTGETITDEAEETPTDDEVEETPEPIEESLEKKLDGVNTRTPIFDLKKISSIVGYGKENTAYIPYLSYVYNTPEEVALSGFGIENSGGEGMIQFNFDRSKITGQCTVRYVLRDDMIKDKVSYENSYIVYYNMDTGFNAQAEEVTVPTFLSTELDKLVERSDRAIINEDIYTLANGCLYTTIDKAVYVGNLSKYVNTLRRISTVRRIVARVIETSTYLVEVETIQHYGSKLADSYGYFRDKSYIVVEQRGDEFFITDEILMSRKMTKEPPISPDTAIKKRLTALSMAGEITDLTKAKASEMLNRWYEASTNRKLHDDVDENGNATAYGMYDCFNQDVTMLSSAKLEYINSHYRDMLVAKGIDVPANYSGRVTEWVGGAYNQVEFMTEELISYEGLKKGIYLQNYYLMSCMDSKWTIDDIVTVDKKLIESAEELKSIQQRVMAKEE